MNVYWGVSRNSGPIGDFFCKKPLIYLMKNVIITVEIIEYRMQTRNVMQNLSDSFEGLESNLSINQL